MCIAWCVRVVMLMEKSSEMCGVPRHIHEVEEVVRELGRHLGGCALDDVRIAVGGHTPHGGCKQGVLLGLTNVGSILLTSAARAGRRVMHVYDATCPLPTCTMMHVGHL